MNLIDSRSSYSGVLTDFNKLVFLTHEYLASYRDLKTAHDRYLRAYKTNNWLKMHGYPMRRKCRKRNNKRNTSGDIKEI